MHFSLTAHLPSDRPGAQSEPPWLHFHPPSPEPIPWALCPCWSNQDPCCCWGLWAVWGREFETGTRGHEVGTGWHEASGTEWGKHMSSQSWHEQMRPAAAHAQWSRERDTGSGAHRPALPAWHTSGLFTFYLTPYSLVNFCPLTSVLLSVLFLFLFEVLERTVLFFVFSGLIKSLPEPRVCLLQDCCSASVKLLLRCAPHPHDPLLLCLNGLNHLVPRAPFPRLLGMRKGASKSKGKLGPLSSPDLGGRGPVCLGSAMCLSLHSAVSCPGSRCNPRSLCPLKLSG